MDDRQYLRSQGFQVGERGRYSKEMLECLQNRNTKDTADEMNGVRKTLGLPIQTLQRDAQELYGLTKGGAKVGFIICSTCAFHMMWCECDKVTAPDNVLILTGASKGIAKLHPRMLQLASI
jgi:hypothetical protein